MSPCCRVLAMSDSEESVSDEGSYIGESWDRDPTEECGLDPYRYIFLKYIYVYIGYKI